MRQIEKEILWRKGCAKKYLRLIEEMNQKSQLRLPAIPALVDCFAIMMSEEEADFLLAVGQAHYSVDDLQQFSKRRGDDWQYFIQRIFAEGFYGCGKCMGNR